MAVNLQIFKSSDIPKVFTKHNSYAIAVCVNIRLFSLLIFKKKTSENSSVTLSSRNIYGRLHLASSSFLGLGIGLLMFFPYFIYFVSNANIGIQLHCLWYNFETYFKFDPCRGLRLCKRVTVVYQICQICCFWLKQTLDHSKED